MNDSLEERVTAKARLAQAAARSLAALSSAAKNAALHSMRSALLARQDEILAANERDMEAAQAADQPASRMDRLRLTPARVADMAGGIAAVAELPDPIGEVLEAFERPNGLQIQKVRVPMGVLAVIYEARPNVTVDAAALALKSGNAVMLRGGSEALASNQAIVAALREGLREAGADPEALQFVDETDRASVDVLIGLRGLVDLAIPRGGPGLIGHVVGRARVPVIETGVGNCHVYVDAAADPDMATAIAVNAKTHRPSVCNAAETLLVHQGIASAWLPTAARALYERGVELRGCPRSAAVAKQAGVSIRAAEELDFATEFLDLILAVRIVDSLEEAIAHIDRYGTKHSEAIVTEDERAAAEFLRRVDAAAVYHNASTRFTDGFEFGFGAEIGISTQKTHARGPMGLRELTSYKYILRGTGQIRA